MKKGFLLTLLAACTSTMLGGCDKKESFTKCTVEGVDFGITDKLETTDEINSFMASIATDNRPSELGLVVSPYFKKLLINDVEIPVYGTRSANGLHSFAYVDIEKANPNLKTKLNIEVTANSLKKSFRKVEVLPLSLGIEATFEKKNFSATVNDIGNYSFVFDGKQDQALTIMIANKDKKENYLTGDITRTVKEIEPGTYTGKDNLLFTETNKVYFFKKGHYNIGSISIPDKSVLFFEPGAYLRLYPDNGSPIYSNNVSDIGIHGHGLLDYSSCNGSQLGALKENIPGKGGIGISNCNNVKITGLMINNAQTWQCCLNCTTNIYIRDVMFYGYRTYADGIMLNNCQDALIEHNFIRTGDDAFETKSTSGTMLTKNVVFQYNNAWTDKAVAYGCIYESRNNTSGVRFYNNYVGFASGNWSKHLGCAVVQMGDNPSAKMYDIVFDGMEIYYSCNQALCNIYIGGSGGMGDGSGDVDDIHFKNISCKTNAGVYMLNLQTYDDVDCKIGKVYMDNVSSGDVKLTTSNFRTYCQMNQVVGGYNVSQLFINGEKCK